MDTSSIHSGKLDDLKKAMKKLTSFVEDNMSRLIHYGFYLNDDGTKMTVVAVHPDSESIAQHMDQGKEEFRKFSGMIELLRIEIYGSVSDSVLERLRQKAKMLGDGSVVTYNYHAGFSQWAQG